MGRVLPGAQFGTRSMQREPAADPVRLGLIRVSTLQPSSELGNQHPRGLGTHGRDARATVLGDPGVGRPCHGAWEPTGGTPVPRCLGTLGWDARTKVLGNPRAGRPCHGGRITFSSPTGGFHHRHPRCRPTGSSRFKRSGAMRERLSHFPIPLAPGYIH